MTLFLMTAIGMFLGGILGNTINNLLTQAEVNNFRQAAGLETKPLTLRRM